MSGVLALRPLVSRDLFGLAEEQARQVLLEAVAGPRRRIASRCSRAGARRGASSRLGGAGSAAAGHDAAGVEHPGP